MVPGVTEDGYSVEFFHLTGNTAGVATRPASAMVCETPDYGTIPLGTSPHRARPPPKEPEPRASRINFGEAPTRRLTESDSSTSS